ncbi:MAG: bZIP transcription factor [Gammaproteobacteria bacterium]|nr:bZIP transcription factor [Gammaproteobacteria bacterium]
MKISALLLPALLVVSAGVFAQQAVSLRPVRIAPALAIPDPSQAMTQASATDSKLQALAGQLESLQAENKQLKAKLDQLNAKVDGNQWTQVAAMANLKSAYEGHTHNYDVRSVKWDNVKINDKWASYISASTDSPRTSSAPNP